MSGLADQFAETVQVCSAARFKHHAQFADLRVLAGGEIEMGANDNTAGPF
jgi:hypothetical protein